ANSTPKRPRASGRSGRPTRARATRAGAARRRSPTWSCSRYRMRRAISTAPSSSPTTRWTSRESDRGATMPDPSPATQFLSQNYIATPRVGWAGPGEPILEPELPIVDPHHHLWDRPGWRYLLDDLLADTGTGHNIVATVYVQARSMHRADGPDELKPV